MKEYIDDGSLYEEGLLIRELTVEEWKRRSLIRGGFMEFQSRVEDSESGLDIYYTASEVDIPLVDKLIEEDYWKLVDNSHFKLCFSFQSKLHAVGDESVIEREIALCKYTLYPDLFSKGELPVFVGTMTPSERERGQLISKAHSEILDHGHGSVMRKSRWDMNYYAVADGHVKYMKWLKGLLEYCRKWNRYGFSEVVNYNREMDLFQGLLGTPTVEFVALNADSEADSYGSLSLRQAALVLRYSGVTINNPLYTSSAAGKFAKQMCGRKKPSSPNQLYRMWVETEEKYGPEYERALFDDLTGGTKTIRSLTNHSKDLKAVRDYLESGEVYERANADYLRFNSELKSLK